MRVIFPTSKRCVTKIKPIRVQRMDHISTTTSKMTDFRIETDSFGEIKVPCSKYYGAQTARANQNFPIGDELDKVCLPIFSAMGIVKKAAALANREFNLEPKIADTIAAVADEVISGQLYHEHFPVHAFMSHTATNMAVNEIISNRAIQCLGGKIGSKKPVHPNDHVNKGQSSNDTYPTAMHIACACLLNCNLLPNLKHLEKCLRGKECAFKDIVKIGRTHLQDAVPVTLGQEFGGYAEQVAYGIARICSTLPRIYEITLGGTAVGTGVCAKKGYDRVVACKIAQLTGFPFVVVRNKFQAQASMDALVELSGQLNVIATSLMKIANDIRMMTSGPHCGLGEIRIPRNECGSSIMPGKVNPTQCDMTCMVCSQVMGNHVAITVVGASGQFELNVCQHILGVNICRSIRLLGDAAKSFANNCVSGIVVREDRIKGMLNQSLMLSTALMEHIGYEKAAKVAEKAFKENITLKQSAESFGITEEQFNKWVVPKKMTQPDE